MIKKSIYKSITDFSKKDPNAYNAACRLNILDEVCERFGWKRNTPKGYWKIKENCIEDAKKYKTLKEWEMSGRGSLFSARRNNWMEACCEHMIKTFIPKTHWTEINCINEGRKHSSKEIWRKKGNRAAMNIARKNGWMDKCCEHMVSLKKSNGYWTEKLCIQEAKKCKTISEWSRNSGGSYNAAMKNGWMDKCCEHMNIGKKTAGYWDIEKNCIEDAKKYPTRTKWQNGSKSSYNAAIRNGWMDKCCEHMKKPPKPNGFWMIEKNCIEDAKKYKTLKEWEENSSAGIQSARKNGWMEKCTKHMNINRKSYGFWMIEKNCIQEAKKYETIGEWNKNSGGSYDSARKNNWFKECTKHMVFNKKPIGYWKIKENDVSDAKKY